MGHYVDGPDDCFYKVQIQRDTAWNTIHAPNWTSSTTRIREDALVLAEAAFQGEDQTTPVRVLAISDEIGGYVEQIMDLRP